jgi:hypothetical protein
MNVQHDQEATSPLPTEVTELRSETDVNATALGRGSPPGHDDIREATFNGRESGPAFSIARPVDQVSAIHGFMIDLDCGILDPAVVGQECVESADILYERHVHGWLDRDAVLSKAEVRNTGHGLHILLWLDEPIICNGDEAKHWDKIARGLRVVLPGDPNLNGIIAMTRPVGAQNNKDEPSRTVTQIRAGEPVSREEILDIHERIATAPARLWMRVFHGGERQSPCPLCGDEKNSLGVAGNWQVQCYGCGRVHAAALVYRHYSPAFLDKRKDSTNG